MYRLQAPCEISILKKNCALQINSVELQIPVKLKNTVIYFVIISEINYSIL